MSELNMGIKDVPHDSFFALAIVLLKLKPKDTTIEEFILAIRKSLVPSPSGTACSVKTHLDTATLWQSLFSLKTKRAQEQSSLVLALQIQLDDLKSSTQNRRQGRKRKSHENEQSQSTSTPLKRVKLNIPSDLGLEDDGDNDEICEGGHTQMLRIILRLAQLLRPRKGYCPEITQPAQLIQQACLVIVEHIPSFTEQHSESEVKSKKKLSIREYCQGARSVWSLLMQYLHQNKTQSQNQGTVEGTVAATVAVVHFLIDRLHRSCLDEADNRVKISTEQIDDQRTKAGLGDPSERTSFNDLCGSISVLLTHILLSAGSLQNTYPPIFEGLACSFLDHLGKTMSMHLFGYINSHELSDGSADTQNDIHMNKDIALLATQLEAPHLIRILHGLMKSQQRNVPDSLQRPVTGEKPAEDFNASVMEKLQNTLLRGLFGQNDSTFMDALNWIPPKFSDLVSEVEETTQPNEDKQDWFLSKVWETLGWDVLLKMQDPYSNSEYP